jgi:hypothetical protein
MKADIRRLQIRAATWGDPTKQMGALNEALIYLQDQVSGAVDGVVQLRPLPAVDLVISSNTPGTLPWPLRLSQVAGAPLGATLMRVENLTTPGAAGVGTTAVAITSQHVEAGAVLVDFISGLTLGARYRFVFGVYNG